MTALNLKPLIADATPMPRSFGGALILAEALRPSSQQGVQALASINGDAPVATVSGPVRATDLAVGDLVLTRDNGYVPVRAIQLVSGEAMLEIAAGVLGNLDDMAIPARSGVVISGPSFDTLFGAREVIVPASALVDGLSVRPMNRTESSLTVVVDLGDAEIIWAGEVAMSCPTRNTAARPVLSGRDAAVAARLAGIGAEARVSEAA